MNSYTSQIVLIKQNQQCGERDRTSLRLSNECQIYWQKHFHKNPLHFRTHAEFEADNEIDISKIGSETTIIYRQNQVPNGYEIVCELYDILKSGCYESPLG